MCEKGLKSAKSASLLPQKKNTFVFTSSYTSVFFRTSNSISNVQVRGPKLVENHMDPRMALTGQSNSEILGLGSIYIHNEVYISCKTYSNLDKLNQGLLEY